MASDDNMKERVAVLESKMVRVSSDVDKIFLLIRKQIQNETIFQKKYMIEMSKLIGKIGALKSKIDSQRSFVGGIIFAVSGMWAVFLTAVGWFYTKGN